MMPNKTFAVVGGDLRQIHLCNLLASENGYSVLAVGLDRDAELASEVVRCRSASEAVRKAGCVVLPLPCSVDGMTVNAPFARTPLPLGEIWDTAGPEQVVVGGKLSDSARKKAAERGFRLFDYYAREEMAVRNTVPTAEGAIQIAMEELPVTIHGAECLVTGFGRVARTLCRDLAALGAHVTGCARRFSDLAWMRTLGYRPVHLTELPNVIGGFDAVLNTVPAVVLTESVLSSLRKDCLVIDLASKPGGVDFETARKLGLKTIWALSLPGRVAPHTAGAIIRDTILNILAEQEKAV